ncbi:MAG: hypothetical protein AB7K41_15350 [Bdellovibrionales bacterium]
MARNSDSRQAEKRALKKLREKGLYTPKDARAAPTKYGRSMIRKYRDVLDGRATVITIPKTKRSKGWKAARDNADPSLGVYAHRNKLVVPKNEREHISWSTKKKTYRVSFWSTDKTTRYVREPVKRKISNPAQIKLREGQRISIPFNRPGRGIEWMNLTEQEFKETWAEYHDRGRYKTMGEHLHISWVVQPDKKRRAKI